MSVRPVRVPGAGIAALRADLSRTVYLVCEKEGRVRPHKFSQTKHHEESDSTRLIYMCQECRCERVYGTEQA